MRAWLDYVQRHGGKGTVMALFVFCAVPVLALTVLLTPPGKSPDEPAHFARALGLLHGAVLAVRQPGTDILTGKTEMQAGVKVNIGLYDIGAGVTTPIGGRSVLTQDNAARLRGFAPIHQKRFVNIPNTATYFPTAYVPAALGVALGRAVHTTPYGCFLLARFGMALSYLALGLLALCLAAFGEAALLAILLLPMSLFLAGTVNQDGQLIALACLACAALTRGARGLGLVAFIVFLCAKPPYAAMLGVFLLPLFGPGFWHRVRQVALALVPVVLWVAYIVRFVVVPFSKAPYHPGPLYTGPVQLMSHTNSATNLHILLAAPSRFFTLPARELLHAGGWRLHEMVGVLGTLQIVFSSSFYNAWFVALALTLVGLLFTARPAATPPKAAAVNVAIVLGLIVLTCWLILIMFYLDWTNVGEAYIAGMQGRYWLPLLPFLLFAVPGLGPRLALPPALLALPVVLMGIYDIGYIPLKLVWYFYLH